MPTRASERRAAERAEDAADQGPPGRGFTRAQAALAAVFLASLLWLIARLDVPAPPAPGAAPGAAPVTAEAPR